MADNVEGLVIELESGASEVGSQLDALTAKLEGLKKTVGSSTPLKTFSRNYQTLIDTINNSTGIDTVKLEGLRAFTQVMSNMNGIKISSSIATQLNNLDFVVQHLSGESLDGLYAFINAMSELNRLQGLSISASFVKNLQALADFASKIQGQNFSSLNELTTALANLAPLANADTASIKGLTASVRTLSNTTRTASSRGRTFNTVLANIRVRTLALVRVTQMIRRATTQAIGVYGDYIETLNLFKMAMGGAGQEAYEFAEKAQALLGIDLTQWMEAQGVFNALASGFGVASDRAAIMSKNLTQLAYDISSFYNIDVDTAVEKVRSGFSGQIRPVRDLGYDLSQARLEAIALSLGIDKTVKSMTQAEKSQLRYIALMTQLKQVQGDLSRTLDSPINQMRILQAQLQQMYRSIGMTLLPILNKVLPYLNAILRVIKMIADEIAAMFGYTLPKITSGDWSSSVVTGAEDLEDELEEANGAAEKLKNTLASFDQINLISSKSGGSGSGAGSADVGGGAFDFALPEYDFLGDAGENKAQQIANNIMKALRDPIDWLKAFILFTVDNLGTIMQIIETLAVVSIGKNLINKLGEATGLANLFKERWGEVVSGLGLITIGVQFSYLGGYDMGQGNWLEGIIKSTLGIGASVIGGAKIGGLPGAIIGLGLGVVFTIEGYFQGNVEATRKRINELFFEFDEHRQSAENLRKAWEDFTASFTNPELAEKNSIANDLKKDVVEIGTSIAVLQYQAGVGEITQEQYAENLTQMYADMEEAVRTHLDGVGQALDESLNGPLGLWLQAHGVALDELRDSFKRTTDNIIEEIEEQGKALDTYNQKLKDGSMTYQEYQAAVEPLMTTLNELYGITGMNVQATDDFVKEFSNLPINFENWDDVYNTLEQVKGGFKSTMDEIERLESEDIAKIEPYIPYASPEDQERMKTALEEVKKYYENQKEILRGGYYDVLQTIENTGTLNWEKIYRTDDLDSVHDALYSNMNKFDQELEKMYGQTGRSRNNEYWTELMTLMRKYNDEAAYGMNSIEGWNQEYIDMFDRFDGKYNLHILEIKEANGKLTSLEKKALEDIRKVYGDTSKVIGKATDDWADKSNYYARTYGKATEDIRYYTENGMKYYVKDGVEYCIGAMDTVSAEYLLLGDQFSNSSTLVDPLTDTMYETAQVLSDAEMLNRFVSGATSLIDGMASVLGDPNNSARVALINGITVSESTTKTIGKKFGDGIAAGLKSSEKDIKDATNSVIKGMVDGFNKFGDGLADYLKAISDAVTGTLNGLNIGFTMSPTATFTVNKKALKIKGYASGGFPNSADFFFANENGVPEYVGTMGGKTAVANNQEITKGVADGVYKAIKDTGLINDVKKIASKDGKVVFAPSEEAGKVMTQSVGMYNGTGGRY